MKSDQRKRQNDLNEQIEEEIHDSSTEPLYVAEPLSSEISKMWRTEKSKFQPTKNDELDPTLFEKVPFLNFTSQVLLD